MAGPHDAPLQALFLPFAQGVLPWSEGPVLFLRARDGFPLREQAVAETLTCEQSFRPFAEALERNGWNVREESEIEADSTRYALVLVL
ncbi:16S rRNA methyltransferase, partial [Xanthomonas oryzae pv. oryzae]